MIRVAAELEARVNLGRVRGIISESDAVGAAVQRFFDCLRRCADVAEDLRVTLLIEPVNRYETSFINMCQAGAEIIEQSGRNCLKLMPDLFHMNIEERSFGAVFQSLKEYIDYIHVADSNRWAPGWGHTPIDDILEVLRSIRYEGYLTGEVLPVPDPDSAARQVIDFLSPRVRRDQPSFA